MVAQISSLGLSDAGPQEELRIYYPRGSDLETDSSNL